MRRAEFAVLPAPACHPAGGLSLVRSARPGVRMLALSGAAILAAVVAVSMAAGPAGREHVARGAGIRFPVEAWGPVSGALGRDDPAYRVERTGAGFVARDPRQRLTTQFSVAGASVRSGQMVLGMRLLGYGYSSTLQVVRAPAPTASANSVLYRYGSLTEWYTNGPLGLEQGFTLTARPTGRRVGPLTLVLALSGDARGVISPGRGVVTFSHSDSSLSYRGLVVTDARGRTLNGWLQLRGRELLLRVDDTGAQYPLRIDPFIQQAKLTASDGAADDFLGDSVAVSGNTIVAGAPNAMVNGNADQGAVYVFVHPRGGWANATETAKLTASDGAANDGLGASVGISGDTVVAGA